jgi:transcriptional regulator with XRE-family HTH domain
MASQMTGFGLIGKRVQSYRQAKNWTIQELAKKAQVSKQTVFRLEHGNEATLPTIDKIANALGVDRDTLISTSVQQEGGDYKYLKERGAEFEWLGGKVEGNFTAYRFGRLLGGSLNATRLELKNASSWREHAGEEVILAKEGNVGIRVGERVDGKPDGLIEKKVEWVIEEGQAFFFHASYPHQYFKPESEEREKVVAFCVWIDPDCKPEDFDKYNAYDDEEEEA